MDDEAMLDRRRAGGGGDRSRKPNARGRGGGGRESDISHALSRLLRHQAEKAGIKLDKEGYAGLDRVLAWPPLRALKPTFDEVRQIVDSSDKKRFALKLGPSGVHGGSAGGAAAESSSSSSSSREPGDWLIRANQGHSIKLESERLLRPIVLATGTATATADGVGAKEDGVVVEEEEEEVVSGGQEAARSQAAAGAEPTAGEAAQPSAAPMARTLSPVAVPPVVVHGTYFAFWSAIVASGGLRPMGRTHVHFSTGLPEDSGAQVVSGMRRDAELLVYVDVARSLRDGVMGWWMSDNGVVLTEGVKGEGREGDTGGGGLVPAKYFKEVVGRKRPASASTPQVGVLWKDGVKVADLPEGLPFRVPQGKGGRGGRGGGGGGGGGGQRGGRGRH